MKKTNYPFPDLILFDWDNTLMDTTPALYQAFCVLCEKYGIPKCSMEEYRARTGMSLRETFPALFGDRWEDAKKVYLDAYMERHLELLTPFADAEKVVAYAAKIAKVGVVSNKTSAILHDEIDWLGWNKYLSAVVGAGDAPKDKPAAEPALLAMHRAGVEYGRPVWFVGDGDADILCAVNADCFPVRVADENKDGAAILTVKNCSELLLTLYSLTETE